VQVRQLTEAYPEFQKRGVRPVMISVDRIDGAAKTKAQYQIPFPVLSDPDLATHEAFHVVHHAGPEEVSKLKGFGLDIEAASGRDHHRFAVPSVFVIDASGTVRWTHVDPDYKVRPSTAQLLAALDGLGIEPDCPPATDCKVRSRSPTHSRRRDDRLAPASPPGALRRQPD
jgi:peroxiredoxin